MPDLPLAPYARLRWNTPLSDAHAALLLDRLDLATVPADGLVADLGCGWGALLLDALDRAAAGVRGVGVDTDGALLDRAAADADARGLGERVTWVHGPAADWQERADRLLCLGAAHAFADSDGAGHSGPSHAEAMLSALRTRTRPGARVLVGDGIWVGEPGPEARAMFGDLPDLTGWVGLARGAGWRIDHLDTTDQREWDDFESRWRAGREAWLRAHPDDERAPEVRALVDSHLDRYLAAYRSVLGFAYAVLC